MDGTEYRPWPVAESRRVGPGVVQRRVLYLGEIDDSRRATKQKTIPVFDEHDGQTCQCAVFPADRTVRATATPAVQVQLNQLQLPMNLGRSGRFWREQQTVFLASLCSHCLWVSATFASYLLRPSST